MGYDIVSPVGMFVEIRSDNFDAQIGQAHMLIVKWNIPFDAAFLHHQHISGIILIYICIHTYIYIIVEKKSKLNNSAHVRVVHSLY